MKNKQTSGLTVVDCDASTSKSKYMHNVSPCLTRSRYRGHWIINKQRRFTKREMFRLQGINPNKFTQVVSDKEMGHQLGNAMSQNVVERILHQVLKSTSLSTVEPLVAQDRWESGEALKELINSISDTDKVDPFTDVAMPSRFTLASYLDRPWHRR